MPDLARPAVPSGPPQAPARGARPAAGGGAADRAGSVAAVLAALGEAFVLVPERAVPERGDRMPRRRTWLDTFDWRLYRAGLLLEHVAMHRGGELRLTARPDLVPGAGAALALARPLAVQPAAGWRPARPLLAGDLPPGPVTDRVAGVIGPRALLPLVTVSTRVTVTRLLNEDAKTVARLVAEYPAVAGAPAGDAGRLAPRLAIAEVRGYPGAARRAARIVATVPGFAPPRADLFTEALAARGRRPGDYGGKIGAEITSAMPSRQAVAVVALRLLDMAEANVPGILRDTDTEFLHDFRVAVRRTRALLKLFGDELGLPAGTARFAAEFKWLGDVTTPVRDLDVHLLGFEDMARRLRAAKPDDLVPLRDYVLGSRAREYRVLARALRSPRFRDLTRQWRDALAPAVMAGHPAVTAGCPAVAAGRTRKAFLKVARLGAAITPDSPHESLHSLRKRCKELRYALEFFAPLYDPGRYGEVIADLRGLQDCLGTFQDSEVQIAEIRSLAAAMAAADAAPAATLLAMGEIIAVLADAQAAARADFGRRFAAFAGTAGRRRMSALLRLAAREQARPRQAEPPGPREPAIPGA
jgi:CHAD domain-containing protein